MNKENTLVFIGPGQVFGYLGDLIKRETGRLAIDHIQRKTIATAKDLLMQTNRRIGEIAYDLGYQYPQYFNRAFKKAVGCSPNEYRLANHC